MEAEAVAAGTPRLRAQLADARANVAWLARLVAAAERSGAAAAGATQ
jgi:hypothetical protein